MEGIAGIKDKVAIITGSARGIGLAIGKTLMEAGAKLILSDIDEALLAEAESELRKISDQVASFKANIANPEEVEQLVEFSRQRLGSVDILINNAGITKDNLFIKMKLEDWKAVLDINLTGAFICCKAVVRDMIKKRSGCIINISSIVGIIGNAGQANYSASKAGLIGLTKTLAKELAPFGVRVNVVAPGFIQTRMTEGLPEEVKQSFLSQIPLGRFGTMDDVAKAVRYLCSDDAGYLTGQVIRVDGGLAM